MSSTQELFRRLTIGDEALLAAIAAHDGGRATTPPLDERTDSLVRVGALVALDAPQSSYQAAVDDALLAGASLDDLLAVVATVAGAVGSARVLSAAPRIALAAGYDVQAALERIDDADR